MAPSSAVVAGFDSADPTPTMNDLDGQAVGVEDVAATLETLAAELRRLWISALMRGDPGEVARLVEAGHDAHVALTAGGVISAGCAATESTVRAIGRPQDRWSR